jgi:hypothetical protein|nr:MAG TPA: hypothetical protein [Crassvirales sp.]
MAYCERLSDEQLAVYKDLGYSDGFIKGAVSLYLEKNPSKSEYPSANQLREFIQNSKYGAYSLNYYSEREKSEPIIISTAAHDLSPFKPLQITIKIGNEHTTAYTIEHAFLLDFVHNLIGKKGAKAFFDSIKDKTIKEVNVKALEEKLKEKIGDKTLLEWFEEKPDAVRQSMLKAASTALIVNKKAKSLFLDYMDKDLNINIEYGKYKEFPESLRQAYKEVISDALRLTALKEFRERKEEEIKALEAGINIVERDAVEQTFTPIQRASRENYIATRVITLGNLEAKKQGTTFADLVLGKSINYFIQKAKDEIELSAKGEDGQSPVAIALKTLVNSGFDKVARKSGGVHSITNDLMQIHKTLASKGLSFKTEHFQSIFDDLDIDEAIKDRALKQAKYRQEEFKKILKHFNILKKGIKMPLLKRENIRLSSKFESAEDITDDIEERSFDFSANEGYAIDSVNKRIRKLLNRLPLMNGDKYILDDLGEKQYLSDTYTYAIIQNALQGTRSYEAMRERLENLSKKYAWVKALTSILDKSANYKPTGTVDQYEMLHNEFFASFFRSRTYYQVKRDVLVRDNSPAGQDFLRLTTFDINNDRASYRNYAEWSNTYMQGIILDEGLSIYDTEGNLHKDKLEAYRKFVKELDKSLKPSGDYIEWEANFINNKEAQENIRRMLRAIGIAPEASNIFDYTTNEALQKLKAANYAKPVDTLLDKIFSSVYTFINDAEDFIKKQKTEGNIVDVNLFNQFKHSYYDLGELIQTSDNDAFLKANFRNSGKMYNSYTTPTYLQTLLDKLSGIEVENYDEMIYEEYLKDGFFKHNYVVQQLARKPEDGGLESRELLDYKEILTFQDKEFKEWTEKDKYTMQLDEFKKEEDSAWYRIPLAGEIKRAGYYRFEKITDDKKLYELFRNLVKQEHERIKETERWEEESKKSPIAPVDKIIKNGKRFHYLPALNTLKIEGQTLMESLESGVIGNVPFSENAIIDKFVVQVLKDIVATEKAKIESYDIKASDTDLVFFILNDLYFRTQFSQLTTGDMANFDSIIDYQKRYKQVMSSTTRLNSGNDVQKTLYISDEVLASTILPEISAIVKERVKNKELTKEEGDIIIESFKSVNATDGQAYRTIDGYKYIMEKSGQWTDAMEEFKKKLDEAFKPDSDVHISYTEAQDFFFNAIKPLVYGSSMVDTGMINTETGEKIYKRINHQHKNSEVLMLAINSFATTSPTLRALTTFARNNGIHVFEFASAVKVGSQGVVNLLEKDVAGQTITINELDSEGNVAPKEYTFAEDAKPSAARKLIANLLEEGKITKEEFQRLHKVINNTTEKEITAKLESATKLDGKLNPSVVHEIPYSSYGFQVNTPEHYYDSKVLIGTQFRKLITSNIEPSNTYVVKTLNTDGMETELRMSGHTFMQTINGKIIENVYDKYEEVREIFEDPLKLESIIQSEIGSNPRYGTEIAKFFNLINDGTIENPRLKFEMALEDPQNSKIIEAIFSGIAKNRINKMKTAGGSLIQMSNFTLSDKLQVKMNPDGKSIDYIPAYVPIYSKGLIDFYGDENGNVDIKKIEEEAPELLEMIGYRIPTESKHSMLPIRIVGFLPNFNGSSIVLPADVTNITGSDFDIDKLYIMRPYLEVESYELDEQDEEGNNVIERVLRKKSYTDGNGFIEGSTPEENYAMRNNFLFDSYMAILKSEHSTGEIFDPSSFAVLNAEAKESFLSSFTYEELYNMVEKAGLMSELSKEVKFTQDPIKDKLLILESLNEERIQKIISTYESSNTPFLSSTMHYFETQNAVGLDLVGISANANTFMAVAQQIKDELHLKEPIVYDGNTYSGYGEIYSPTGKNIQRTVGQFVIAAVDNVKAPALAYMKADVGNLGSIIAGVALGLPTRDLAIMSNLGLLASKRTLNKGKSLMHYMDVLKKVDMGKSIDENFALDSKTLKLLQASLPDIKKFIDEKLGGKRNFVEAAKALEEKFSNISKADLGTIINGVAAMVRLEAKLIDLGSAFRKIIGVTKLDTFRGAVGPTAADTLIKYLQVKEDVEYLTSEISPIAVSKNFLDVDGFKDKTKEEIKNELLRSGSHFYKAFFYFGMDAAFDYMSQHFNVLNKNFLPVIERLRDLGMAINVKNINLAYEHYMLYHMSGTEVMNDNLNETMFKDIPLQFIHLQEKYKELRSLLIFKTMKRVIEGQITSLDFVNANELEAQRRDQFTREWEYLLDVGIKAAMVEGDTPEAKKEREKRELFDFAINLYRYGLYRGNIGYKYKGINHLAPARLKRMFNGYGEVVGNMRNIVDSMNNGDERFVRQFLSNNNVLYENYKNPRLTANSFLGAIDVYSEGWSVVGIDDIENITHLDDEFTLLTKGSTPPSSLLISGDTYIITSSYGSSFTYTKLKQYFYNSPFVRYSRYEDFPEEFLDKGEFKSRYLDEIETIAKLQEEQDGKVLTLSKRGKGNSDTSATNAAKELLGQTPEEQAINASNSEEFRITPDGKKKC